MSGGAAPRGPAALLLRNAPYRRLWLAGFISFFGDWFTIVALVRVVHEATGGRLAVGVLLATQMLPSLLFSSLAGSVSDRLPRRRVMIACDLLRAGGALGYLALAESGDVGGLLALVFAQHALGAFFRPAAVASVPHLVKPEELSAAGFLDGLSWSLALVIGSFAGGVTVDHLGIEAAFAIDAATFLASAACVRGLPLPSAAAAPERRVSAGLGDFAELREECRRTPSLAVALFAKCAWGVGAAQILMLTDFGEKLLSAAAASTGFGLLYAARGAGTAVGPLLARRVLGETDGAIRRSIALGFAAAALFYALFSLRPPMALALACVAAAHAGGSAIWIGSTVLVQRLAPDRVRGRALAAEMAFNTLTGCASPIAAGALVDAGVEPTRIVLLFAGVTAATGAAWTLAALRVARRTARA